MKPDRIETERADPIQRGNDGIDIGTWTGPPPMDGKHGLPGREHIAGADWDAYDLLFFALAAVGVYLGAIV